jgi:hypothetical protein
MHCRDTLSFILVTLLVMGASILNRRSTAVAQSNLMYCSCSSSLIWPQHRLPCAAKAKTRQVLVVYFKTAAL